MYSSTDTITLGEGFDPKARAVPGAYWDREAKSYLLNLDSVTPRAAAAALRLFPELQYEAPSLVKMSDELVQNVRPFDNATPYGQAIEAHGCRQALTADGHDFYHFQEIDLGYMAAVLEEHGAGYIGWGRGMGKTLGACALIEELGLERVLVVAPNTAKATVWEPEVRKYLPYHHCLVLPNAKTQRERMMAHLNEDHLVLIVHYESLAIIGGPDGRGWKRLPEWDIVIADEAHRIKNPTTKMSRAIKKIPAKRKLALSGSIIENHADELFSPLQWMFPNLYKSKWRDWNDRYLDYIENGYGRIFIGIKLERLAQMREELGTFMVYRRKQDELDLPPRTDQTLLVDLSPGQRKAYEELQAECMTELENESLVSAMDGLPMLTKLRQIATGLDLVGEVQDSTKLSLAAQLIEDNPDEKTVVFSWYKAAANALADRLESLGISAFVITGDVPQKRRSELIARFQEDETQVLIGTLSTMGESVNLQSANNAIFLDRSWNPATNVQAEDRIYRIGQDQPVIITHIIARDTVDELRVMPTIANKEALRRLILGGS